VSPHLEAIARAAARVRESADDLNRLDSAAGDGDLGITMSAAAAAVMELLPGLDGKSAGEVLQMFGRAIARTAPSTSGTLLATGLLRAAKAVASEDGSAAVAAGLEAARAAIAERGGATEGSKTMLDALAPAARAASKAAAAGSSPADTLRMSAAAADAGATATVGMRAQHGRAGWLADRSSGHEDAGARFVALLLSSYADAVGELTSRAS
jgi:dihydroxyacetone kinase-like protein